MTRLLLRHDPMVRRLMRLTGVERTHAVGLVVDLWLWTADSRPLGILTDLTPEDLVLVFETDLDAELLWKAMVNSGVIWELEGPRFAVANWLDEDLGRHHAKFHLSSSFAGHMAQHIRRDRYVEECWACRGEVPVAIPITEILRAEKIAEGFPHPKKRPPKRGTT